MEIFKNEGLSEFEDHPEKIFHYAKLEYAKTDHDFRMALQHQEDMQVSAIVRIQPGAVNKGKAIVPN